MASAAASSREADASRAAAAEQQAQDAASAAAGSAADAAAAAAAAGAAGADPDTPGEDGGARCANNPQYADEQPIGMRADAAAAWRRRRCGRRRRRASRCAWPTASAAAHNSRQTYDDYVAQYGQAMADQYVLPPEKSAHVLGLAVDVQPYAAYTWLESTRGALGFCRIYDNEAWHFEYSQAFTTAGCPARLPHPGA